MEELRNTIKTLMKEQGVKQYVIAQRVGITAQQFSAMLHGKRGIGAQLIPKLAKALHVTPNKLYGVPAGAKHRKRPEAESVSAGEPQRGNKQKTYG